MAVIELEAASLVRGAFRLERVDLVLREGEYAVLMGRSGSGKTSLLEAIAGLVPLTGGRVRLGGRDVTHAPPAARGVGYVPQDGALFRSRDVAGNLGFALELRGASRREVTDEVAAFAERLGISALLRRRVGSLSGGERQRVAIGRALLARPRVLLLDEPLSALDEALWESTGRLLRRLQTEETLTVLHVTHRESEARWLGQRRLRIVDGQISEIPHEGAGTRALAVEEER